MAAREEPGHLDRNTDGDNINNPNVEDVCLGAVREV